MTNIHTIVTAASDFFKDCKEDIDDLHPNAMRDYFEELDIWKLNNEDYNFIFYLYKMLIETQRYFFYYLKENGIHCHANLLNDFFKVPLTLHFETRFGE